MSVNPKSLQLVDLLVYVLHEVIVVRGQLQTNDFRVLLAANIGRLQRQRFRIRQLSTDRRALQVTRRRVELSRVQLPAKVHLLRRVANRNTLIVLVLKSG